MRKDGFRTTPGNGTNSGHDYKVDYWEVFNEPDFEYGSKLPPNSSGNMRSAFEVATRLSRLARPWQRVEKVAFESLWRSLYVERLIGSIRRDCLNRFLILNARHLKRTLTWYSACYHGSRTHLGLDKQCPIPRQAAVVAMADDQGLCDPAAMC